MEEIGALWKYTNKLEYLLVKSIKQNNRFKRNVKNKLKNLSLLLIEKGVKPDDIVKIINSSKPANKEYDFSEESDDQLEQEGNINMNTNLNVKQLKNIIKTDNANDSDTDSDSEMDLIARQADDDKILSEDILESLQKVRKFIERSNQVLKKEMPNESENIVYHKKEKNRKESNSNGKPKKLSPGVNNIDGKDFINKKRKFEE